MAIGLKKLPNEVWFLEPDDFVKGHFECQREGSDTYRRCMMGWVGKTFVRGWTKREGEHVTWEKTPKRVRDAILWAMRLVLPQPYCSSSVVAYITASNDAVETDPAELATAWNMAMRKLGYE